MSRRFYAKGDEAKREMSLDFCNIRSIPVSCFETLLASEDRKIESVQIHRTNTYCGIFRAGLFCKLKFANFYRVTFQLVSW